MAERTRVVVTDANVLINLIHVGRLDLLARLPDFEFVVPPEVEAEVTVPEQAAVLKQALDTGEISREAFMAAKPRLAAIHDPARRRDPRVHLARYSWAY